MDFCCKNSKSASPENNLLACVLSNKTDKVRKLVEKNRSLLGYIYLKYATTILPIACLEEGIRPAIIEKLIELGADLDGSPEFKPLHLAAKNPNYSILEALIPKLTKEQINDADKYGNNALHALIKGRETQNGEAKFQKHVKLLLTSGLDVNRTDDKNCSPILLAADKGFKTIIKTIIATSVVLDADKNIVKSYVDLDSHKSYVNKSARELIIEKKLYGGRLPEEADFEKIFCLLEELLGSVKESKEEDFINLSNSLEFTTEIINSRDNSATLLQFVCERGLSQIVKRLLDKGADVNLTSKNNPKRPIELATSRVNSKIFEMLLKQEKLEISEDLAFKLLVELLKKLNFKESEKCVEVLLKKVKINLNKEDKLNHPPLYYSLRYGSDALSSLLINFGASLTFKNSLGRMPIEEIDAILLQKILNGLISYDDENVKVTFDYQQFISFTKPMVQDTDSDEENLRHKKKLFRETEVVECISRKPNLQHLIVHPVIISYLLMKWEKQKWFFLFNLIFYMLIALSLIFYTSSELRNVVFVVLNVNLLILFFIKLMQMRVLSPKKFIFNFDNCVKIILIGITEIIVWFNINESDRRWLLSIDYLLVALVLLLVAGQHPKLSTFVEMLKAVAYDYFKLLLCFSFLLIGFALSFNNLFAPQINEFSSNNSTKTEDNYKYFSGRWQAIFSTILMMVGEFNSDSIYFDEHPFISRTIFLLFVLTITIILLNLLNGLAVSDIQTIKTTAELFAFGAQAQHIYALETLVSENILPISLVTLFQKRVKLLTSVFSGLIDCQLEVFLEDGKISKCGAGNSSRKKWWSGDVYLKKETLQELIILVRKKTGNDLESSED